MATSDKRLRVVEKSRLSPPPNTVSKISLPLNIFDLVWLIFPSAHQLFFYDFPHPKTYFLQTVIPKLKQSLSITLQHFSPFAGNLLIFPPANDSDHIPRKPEIRYIKGDSVSVIFAECDLDFDMKQNHPQECNKFYSLVPILEPPVKASDYVKIPAFMVQVTILPNSRIAIGITSHHSLCDAKIIYDFFMTWTSIYKHGTDELFLANNSLPFYDRVIEYPSSIDDLALSIPPIKSTIVEGYRPPQLDPQTDKVRYTLVLTRSQINILKKWLLVQLPTLEYVSSFVVGCGLTWSCMAKSRVQVEGTKGEYEVERFLCVADWRARLDPPVPEAYFGNCVAPCVVKTKTTLLTDNKGFQKAVELIGAGIRESVNSKQGLAKDARAWLDNLLVRVPTTDVAGTPKRNLYDIDFGWGEIVKCETISIDYSNTLSVNARKDSPEDIEIALSLPPKQMDTFISIFQNKLESVLSHDF